jgi:hypothetical protein
LSARALGRSKWVRFGAPAIALALFATGCGSGTRGIANDNGAGDWRDGGVRYPVDNQTQGSPGTQAVPVPAPQPSGSVIDVPATLTRVISSNGPGYKLPSLCRSDGTIDTGPLIHPAWVPPCVAPYSGNNGGATARGVTGDTIHLAYYLTEDPTIQGADRAVGGCGTDQCTMDYVNAYLDWFTSYYQFYGRRVDVQFFKGSSSESDTTLAIKDADAIANLKPQVFAALNGPAEAGAAYARELASKGIMCFCTYSAPQDFYQQTAPYVWSWWMSSTQAYIHRAAYIGRRLAGRDAIWAGPTMKTKKRTFALVWFDDNQGTYKSGVDFFNRELAKYGVHLTDSIRYVNIEGCQTGAATIVNTLLRDQVTSVMLATDPLCPTALTYAAEAQGAQWEWLVSGSILTDTNAFGQMYQSDQWDRAFGLSMETPLVTLGDWYTIYEQERPGSVPKVDAILALQNLMLFSTGVHMAGPKLTPWTFRAGMARMRPIGGTKILARISFGPKKIDGYSFWDTTAIDDMTEVWWGAGAYHYIAGGLRYLWGAWPSTAPDVFNAVGAVTEYTHPPQ